MDTQPALEIIDNGSIADIYTLEAQHYNLGRTKTNHIVIAHESVSRLHAMLQRNGGGYDIFDKSRHGTFINGLKIPKHESIPLRDGDQIKLSGSPLVLHFRDPLMTADPPVQLTYHSHTRHFSIKDYLLTLTNQEHTLLHLLYTRMGQVCSYTACGHAIWGQYDPLCDQARLYKVAADLRRKLRNGLGLDPNSTDLYPLTSSHGKGYTLQI